MKRYCRIDNSGTLHCRRSRLGQERLSQYTSFSKAGENRRVVRGIAALDLPARPLDITDAHMTLLAPVLVQPAEVCGQVDADNKRTSVSNGRRDLGRRLRPPSLIRKQHDEASHHPLRIDDMHIAELAAVEAVGCLKRQNRDGSRCAKGDGLRMTPLALNWRGTPANRSKQSAGGQGGNVEKCQVGCQESRSGEIPWLPDRIEFVLEGAQALKIVEAVSMGPDQATLDDARAAPADARQARTVALCRD